jgi:hypothetical protein
MLIVNLTDEDVVRLKVIEMDRDADDALAFVRERIMPQIKKQQASKIHGHLEGGKGSML